MNFMHNLFDIFKNREYNVNCKKLTERRQWKRKILKKLY